MTTVRDKSENPEIIAEEHALKLAEAENRMQNSPVAQRAKKSKENGGSVAYKSKIRALNSMRDFFATTAMRDKRAGWKTRKFTDPDELSMDCYEFIGYCLEHEIIPTWNLFAVWMDCDVTTLYAEENLSSPCSQVLKKLRNLLFTILEQFSMQTEGNPASAVFHEKALWGLSDQQPLDVNVHMDGQKQLSSAEVQQVIDLTPDEIHETT